MAFPEKGHPVPPDERVFRLIVDNHLTADGKVSPQAFSLSTLDREDPLCSLSVWSHTLSSPLQAVQTLGEKKSKYNHTAALIAQRIREVRPTPDMVDVPTLNVVWDPLDVSVDGWAGHAGITGLDRPPQIPSAIYKDIRSKLAEIANEQLSKLA